MSQNDTNPMRVMFDAQRSTIERTEDLFETTFAVSDSVASATDGALRTGKSAQKGAVNFGRRSAHAYLDAVAATVPGSEAAVEAAREAVDEGYGSVDELHDAAWEAYEESLDASYENYEELSERQRAAFEDAMAAVRQAADDFETGARSVDID